MTYYTVDDQDPHIEYLCNGTVSLFDVDTFYGGTYSTMYDPSPACVGWFHYAFNGQAVNVHANNQDESDGYKVSLDNSAFGPQSTNGSYASGMLKDGNHTLVYAVDHNATAPILDYLTVMAGEETEMRGRTVIVDDADLDVVTWDWQWEVLGNQSPSSFGGRGAYNDTVHMVGPKGGSFNFTFIGSAFAVYSVIPAFGGNVSLDYSIDEASMTDVTISNRATNPVPMFKIVEEDSLPAGKHTVQVNITSVEDDMTIGIDFITYTAAFDHISELSVVKAAPASSSKKSHVGAIVGGIVGGLVFVGIIMLALFVMKRRRVRKARVSAVIGRNYNPNLDVKVVPRPVQESYHMSNVQSARR